LFGLEIELLVPALGLSGLLPKLIGAASDLFHCRLFHLSSFSRRRGTAPLWAQRKCEAVQAVGLEVPAH
jgi:hypothetical protein